MTYEIRLKWKSKKKMLKWIQLGQETGLLDFSILELVDIKVNNK